MKKKAGIIWKIHKWRGKNKELMVTKLSEKKE